MKKTLLLLILLLALTAVGVPPHWAEPLGEAMGLDLWVKPAKARHAQQFSDPVEQGEYFSQIAGCISCHTPFADPVTLEINEALLFSGGNPFPLGPLGIVFTRNLTPDRATGLGDWTDEEIKTAIRTGRKRDGTQLFPVMPYTVYNNMADADVEAIVAYLRTLPPIENQVPDRQLTVEELPEIPLREGIIAPDPSDIAARGEYLVTAVMACTDCHTPLNPETGQPQLDQYLAGGQPFEGPWGVIYGGNITPDRRTGIGDWSDEEIARVLREGIRRDGRRVVLMPWRDYRVLTEDDMKAVIHYLRNGLAPVEREVPAAALNEEFIEFVELPAEGMGTMGWVIGGTVAAVVVAGVALALRRRRTH